MSRIALLVEYFGKHFHGSQSQVGVRTVQSELEAALAVLSKREIRVTFSGRTDSGVHALGQVVHFDWPEDCLLDRQERQDTDRQSLDTWRLAQSLNGIMKDDIAVRCAQVVPGSFHARFSATSRQYVYRILNRPHRSALLKDTHYFIPQRLDLERMQNSALQCLGKHDFASFRSTNADKSSTCCTVNRSELLKLGEGQLEFWISADRFVYNMVRIIVGTLVEIGLGKRQPQCVGEALSTSNRDLCGPTAPPWGLTLISVSYGDEYKLFLEESFHTKA